MRYLNSLNRMLSAFLLLLILMLPVRVAAAANSITLSSSAATASQGSIFSIAVLLNAQDPIDVVQGYVTWDESKVEFQAADYSNTDWKNDTEETVAGNNYYQSSRYRLPPFTTGTTRIVELRFSAKSDSGNAEFKVSSSNSFALMGGKNMLSSVAGVSVELVKALPAGSNPLPGTIIPGGAEAASFSGNNENNGTVIGETAVTEEEAESAVRRSAERTAEIAATQAVAETKDEDKAISGWLIAAGAALILLIGAGIITLLKLSKRRRGIDSVSSSENSISTTAED